MEACNLLLSFRDLSFTGLQVLLMIYFFFPFHADLFPLFFFFCCSNLVLSPPLLLSSSYPSCLLFIIPFLLLFIHPHLMFLFSYPVLHTALFLSSILSHPVLQCSAPCSLFSHCESCPVRFLT